MVAEVEQELTPWKCPICASQRDPDATQGIIHNPVIPFAMLVITVTTVIAGSSNNAQKLVSRVLCSIIVRIGLEEIGEMGPAPTARQA